MTKTAMETTSPNLPNHSNVSKENARQEPPKKHKGLAVFLLLALAAGGVWWWTVLRWEESTDDA